MFAVSIVSRPSTSMFRKHEIVVFLLTTANPAVKADKRLKLNVFMANHLQPATRWTRIVGRTKCFAILFRRWFVPRYDHKRTRAPERRKTTPFALPSLTVLSQCRSRESLIYRWTACLIEEETRSVDSGAERQESRKTEQLCVCVRALKFVLLYSIEENVFPWFLLCCCLTQNYKGKRTRCFQSAHVTKVRRIQHPARACFGRGRGVVCWTSRQFP